MADIVKPLRDGWIILRPGESIEFDRETPVSPSQLAIQSMVRNLRGAVLSAAFDLESTLDICLLEFFFGDGQSGDTDKKAVFADSILREMGFEKKIRMAVQIGNKTIADVQVRRSFAETLNEARVLRNLMAHYPCWLEPIKVDGTDVACGFVAYIAKGENLWKIDDTQVSTWIGLLAKAVSYGETLVKELQGNP